MAIERHEYPFPLPQNAAKDDFIKAVQDVAKAINERNGQIESYDERAMGGGGEVGVFVVLEER